MTTFATLRSQHADTLRRCNAGPITPELIKEVEGFIETVRQAGREIADEDDREYLRSLLTFWGNWYYNQTRTYPNTNLELITPEAAAAHGREVAKKVVKSEPVSSGSNRFLSGCGVVVLGLVALIAIVALAIAALPLMFEGAASPPSTPPLNIAVQETVAAIATETAFAESLVATNQPSTSLAVVTVEVVASATPSFTLPTETATPALSASPTVAALTPTSSSSGDEPTPTTEFGVGGGGFVPQIGFLSIQIVEPSISDSLVTNQPFNIGAAYSNLQPGWTLFYVLSDAFGGYEIIVPQSFEIALFNETGLWTESALLDRPGLYNISVYITTTTDSRAVIQRYADASASLPPDLNLEGVITFYNLTTIQVN